MEKMASEISKTREETENFIQSSQNDVELMYQFISSRFPQKQQDLQSIKEEIITFQTFGGLPPMMNHMFQNESIHPHRSKVEIEELENESLKDDDEDENMSENNNNSDINPFVTIDYAESPDRVNEIRSETKISPHRSNLFFVSPNGDEKSPSKIESLDEDRTQIEEQ